MSKTLTIEELATAAEILHNEGDRIDLKGLAYALRTMSGGGSEGELGNARLVSEWEESARSAAATECHRLPLLRRAPHAVPEEFFDMYIEIAPYFACDLLGPSLSEAQMARCEELIAADKAQNS